MVFTGREGGGWGAAGRWQRPSSLFIATLGLTVFCIDGSVLGDSPFAIVVVEYDPAPGQFVNNAAYNDPSRALGAPSGGGTSAPNNTGLVSLGGFGGSITLAFDHTVYDDHANPFGLDVIVFGNSFWVAGHMNRSWAEAGIVEISRDVNSNGLDDDAWYLIPGSHIDDPVGQFTVQIWDDDFGDGEFPPASPVWVPFGLSDTWTTEGYQLVDGIFQTAVLENPNGLDGTEEGVYGYADVSPTESLPDGVMPGEFYVRPDDPFLVGLTPGAGGGDAFDIAWAIDPFTGAPAGLDGFDFIKISGGIDFIAGALGEISTEIDGVSDVVPGMVGDADGDGDIDLDDNEYLHRCLGGPDVAVPTSPCRVVDFDDDGDVDLLDARFFQSSFGV